MVSPPRCPSAAPPAAPAAVQQPGRDQTDVKTAALRIAPSLPTSRAASRSCGPSGQGAGQARHGGCSTRHAVRQALRMSRQPGHACERASSTGNPHQRPSSSRPSPPHLQLQVHVDGSIKAARPAASHAVLFNGAAARLPDLRRGQRGSQLGAGGTDGRARGSSQQGLGCARAARGHRRMQRVQQRHGATKQQQRRQPGNAAPLRSQPRRWR